MKLIDLTGRQFGRLTVDGRGPDAIYRSGKRAKWFCTCACGTRKLIFATSLRYGRSQSCGCLAAEVAANSLRTHGGYGTDLYRVWSGMKERCSNRNHNSYPWYGGRGISVCDAWLNSFDRFEADMGPRPSPEHSIDRINGNGNYEPGNCRWATMNEQIKNRRPRARRSA